MWEESRSTDGELRRGKVCCCTPSFEFHLEENETESTGHRHVRQFTFLPYHPFPFLALSSIISSQRLHHVCLTLFLFHPPTPQLIRSSSSSLLHIPLRFFLSLCLFVCISLLIYVCVSVFRSILNAILTLYLTCPMRQTTSLQA